MRLSLIPVMGLLLLLFPLAALATTPEADKVFSKGLEQLKLTVPAGAPERDYLGLTQESGQFSLSQVKADVLIVEIFSMYCPFCQRHAPATNKLFNRIQARNDLKDRVKLMGLGISNSAYEVNVFRKKYAILFPLIEDKGWSVANALPGIRTPHYFGIRKKGDTMEVFYSKQGAFADDGEFLNEVLKESGITFR